MRNSDAAPSDPPQSGCKRMTTGNRGIRNLTFPEIDASLKLIEV
jgi:hypothetical protein